MKKLIVLALLSNAALAQDISIPVNDKTSAIIGTGYSSENQANSGQCIDGEVQYVGKQDSNFNLDTTIRQEALEKSLGMEAGFRVRTGVTTYSGSAKFLKASKSNSHSITLNYSSDYSFKQRIISNPKLNDIGSKFRDNPDRFKKTCGDNFIYKQNLGAKLFYNLKISFDSKEAKDYFEAKVKMSSSMSSAYAGLVNAKNHFSSKTKVTFTAYQLGGDISKITSLISDIKDAEKEKNSAYAYVECTFGSLKKCEEVMKAAINYATDTKSGFPSQLNPNSTDTSQGPAVIQNFAKDYRQIGEYVEFSPELTFVVKTARKKLSDLFENVFTQQNKAYQLLNEGIVRLSPGQKEKLQNVESHLYEQMQFLAEGIEYCYDKPKECPEVFESVKSEIKLYDESIFTVPRESFAQHCDFSLSSFSSEALRTTVNALVRKAKEIDPDLFVPGADGIQVDQCSIAETILQKAETLDLSNENISSLEPLAAFVNLRKLDLSSNKISDISDLENLTNLSNLNLNNNKISSISSLSNLRKLEEIHLVNNNVQDVTALADLRFVRKLDIRNNSEALKCPYADSKICYVIDFDRKISIVPLNSISRKRSFHTSTLLGDQILLVGGTDFYNAGGYVGGSFGGYSGFGNSFGEVVLNDLSSNVINKCDFKTQVCDIPYSFEDKNQVGVGFSDQGYIFSTATKLNDSSALIIGGFKYANASLVEKINENKISIKPLAMTSGRSEHTAIQLKNGDVLIAGGWTGYGMMYLPGEKEKYPLRALESMFPLDASASAEVFNLKDNKFTRTMPMNVIRAGHTASLLDDGRVLIIGGFNFMGKSLNTMEIFDPKTGRFTLLPSKLQFGRGHHKTEILNNGKIIVIGGYTEIKLKDKTEEDLEIALKASNDQDPDDLYDYPATAAVEIIDPVTFKVTTLENKLTHARGDHAMVKLDNGMILIAGGASSYRLKNKMRGTCRDCLDTIEVFDPETATFTQLKDKLYAPAMGMAATALDKERVLLTGQDSNALILVSPN